MASLSYSGDHRRQPIIGNTMALPDTIYYAQEPGLSAQEFQAVLIASTLAERRPYKDIERLTQMIQAADIVVTARADGRLVGISRAITDFSYCCYLSDLAVDTAFQHQGIGKRLIEETHKIAGDMTSLILVAAPAAEAYYPRIGMQPIKSAWMFPRQQ